MERRVAGIIRWLERCLSAYKGGALENALMDAECARADVENLREELWTKLERRHSKLGRRQHFFKPVEALLLAFAIILATVTPLTMLQYVPEAENSGGGYVLEWVTPDEMELLSNIRKRPEDSLALVVSADALLSPARAAEPVKRRSQAAGVSNEPVLVVKETETSIPYDRILSLIEAGERAMKDEKPVIKVENTNLK